MARAHARAIRRLSVPVTITGVYDADASTADEFAVLFSATAFSSTDELLSGARPEIVHVCTTAGSHFEAARQALRAGAHLYVEKPFVETAADARALLSLARQSDRVVCAGHQLLADPAHEALFARAGALQPVTRIESVLAFASPTVRRDAPLPAHAAQLLDVVPHPLYTLVAALERAAPGQPLAMNGCRATACAVEAFIDAGEVQGRLRVSLVDRPVASTLSLNGAGGTLTADFMRGCVTGVDNPGTSPIEKILNPVFEGAGIAWRSIAGVARRYTTHGEYPGLAALLERFYLAVRDRTKSPTTPEHLMRVTELYEHIAVAVRESVAPPLTLFAASPKHSAASEAPVVAVTGASGFLGRHLARALADRGFVVRGIGRGPDPRQDAVAEWIRTDVSRSIPANAFRGVHAVVHAAAATSGGFAAHQRGSIDASRVVMEAAAAAGVRRVVHVSSLSVVAPPSSYRELQSETTPLAPQPRTLGPYTWGKTESEAAIARFAATEGIGVRIIRPAALTDRNDPELPGLVGKRLFGPWHLLLGRPSHAFAACDVELAARAIAWTVAAFEEAPPVVNLLDPEVATRDLLLRRMRKDGWKGRGVWIPVWMLAAGVTFAKRIIGTLTGKRGERLDVWGVLRPRRFDPTISERVLAAARRIEATDRRTEHARFSSNELKIAATSGSSF